MFLKKDTCNPPPDLPPNLTTVIKQTPPLLLIRCLVYRLKRPPYISSMLFVHPLVIQQGGHQQSHSPARKTTKTVLLGFECEEGKAGGQRTNTGTGGGGGGAGTWKTKGDNYRVEEKKEGKDDLSSHTQTS